MTIWLWLEAVFVWGSPLVALAALAAWGGGWSRVARLLGGLVTFASLLALSGEGETLAQLTAKGILFAALAVGAVVDWQTRQVPRELSWAWLLAGLVVAGARFVQVQDTRAIPYGVGVYALWQAGILGGGDAKLLLGAFGLWPEPMLLACIVAITLARGLVFVAWRYRDRAARHLAQVTLDLARGATRPAPTHAATWAYALALGLYLWRFV
jgi:Flp pilus assembly protein protease CpaA